MQQARSVDFDFLSKTKVITIIENQIVYFYTPTLSIKHIQSNLISKCFF